MTRAENNYCAKLHHVPVAYIDTTLVLAVLNLSVVGAPRSALRKDARHHTAAALRTLQ